MTILHFDRADCHFNLCPMPRVCDGLGDCGHRSGNRPVLPGEPARSPAERQADAILDLYQIDPALGRAALVRFFEETNR